MPLGAKKRTSSQISEEARPSAFGEIWKRRVKWGHTISPIHFTQPSTQLLTVKLVVFSRSQIHSYAYHLVSVRRHNQHVRSPIQGFFRCEGISFIPRVKQRSTFLQLSPQERTNYITSHRPASIAAPRSNWLGRSDPHPLLKTTFLKQRFFGARANSPVFIFHLKIEWICCAGAEKRH